QDADDPRLAAADTVGEMPRGQRPDESDQTDEREADADLHRRQTDHVREEDDAAGQEGAAADGEDHGLEREAPLQSRRWKDSRGQSPYAPHAASHQAADASGNSYDGPGSRHMGDPLSRP